MLRLTDLREILRYVPRFRDRVFVIAIDGAIVEDDNFPNLLLDIALLRSLSVRVALVHGAAYQVERYAKVANVSPSTVNAPNCTLRSSWPRLNGSVPDMLMVILRYTWFS